MFATLLGDLPRPPLDAAAAPEAILDACLQLQLDHGLEPLTDGGRPVSDGDTVTRWTTTAARAGGLVKAVLLGPVSSARPVETLRDELLALTDAGCRWIEIHEPAVVELAATADRSRIDAFADAHRRLTDGISPDVHLSLALLGGNADRIGIDPLLAGRYASLALDLIDGPEDWRLAVAAPNGVGLVCGVVDRRAGSDDSPELLVWAATYAAATGGRGMDRVGLATAGSLAGLTWAQATTKLAKLGRAARLATASPEGQAAELDPRALDIRSAALGRGAPPPPPRRGSR